MSWNLKNSYAELPEFFYTKINPKKVPSPQLVILNEELAKFLDLNINYLKSNEGISILAGNELPNDSVPIAQAYAGHQFGHFTMLGDGRAILLGEQKALSNEVFDIQLKGSGRTPYSRGGDGRAALGPMLREYIISESMYALNIPTTRSLAVIKTGQSIVRDKILSGAILTRVAASHIRVGTFEYTASFGSKEEIKLLADFTINRHYSYVKNDYNPYLGLLKEVIKKQALLIAKWMLVGFIHGVMNTDNMTISGETIDYGPCAFMDTYDLNTVFSSIDTYGRYSYGNQPSIALWNLTRFAEALLPVIHDDIDEAIKIVKNSLNKFNELYNAYWLTGMRAKLGIYNDEAKDENLIKELLDIMYKYKADYTNSFLYLTKEQLDKISMSNSAEFIEWHNKWQQRCKRQEQSKEASIILMKKSNPAVIPRNHRVEEALEAIVKYEDYTIVNNLLKVLSKPFEYSTEQEKYQELPPSSFCKYKTFCGT